ncbi:MAG: hypothetical protein CMN84_00950 [Spongiibacteraceae bacterium]|nr:hypothetical protein [Spongiibacteraceae bacterium]
MTGEEQWNFGNIYAGWISGISGISGISWISRVTVCFFSRDGKNGSAPTGRINFVANDPILP